MLVVCLMISIRFAKNKAGFEVHERNFFSYHVGQILKMENNSHGQFKTYEFIWSSDEWVIYKSSYEYFYLVLNAQKTSKKDFALWQKVDPKLEGKPLSAVKKHIAEIPVEWYRVRVIPKLEIEKYELVCSKFQCPWKIISEVEIDYDIANSKTAESVNCPDDLYDELVQYAIKKGAQVIDVEES